MSGTLGNIYNHIHYALQLHSEAMTRLQEQASTGSRLNRASDDPSTAYRVLGLNSQNISLGNYIDNLSDVIQTLETSSSIIENIISQFADTRTRLTQITSGIYDDQGRQIIAEGIDNILEQVVLLANTKHGGQYLFGGSNTRSAPYAVQRANGKIVSVTYQGSSENREIEVAPGSQSVIFYVGNDIFRSNDRGTPIFIGSTGAAPGTGTSSVTGDIWLTVTYDVDHYKLSIDDGVTWVDVPVGGDTNQPVTDPQTGKVLYVDSTGINSTGVEMISVPGTYDIFNTLIGIRDALKNEKGFSEAQLQEIIDNLPNSLQEISNVLVQTSSSLGSKTGLLENLKNILNNQKYNAEDEVSLLEDADIAQVAIDLSRRELLYQMSLSVAGKLMSISLLDFIE
jgi:flagellar hook-associated protein 3 FlgL